jgi:tetratricopeptide (TPR) repeat protein
MHANLPMSSAISKWLVAVAACLLACAQSGRASAQPRANELFQQGMTALHLFEYEDANEAFIQARRIDPAFVMAYWGEAMTYHQTLWRHENLEAARQALARLAPTPSLRRAKTNDPMVQGWLGAVEHLFGAGDVDARRRAYADAMAQIYRQAPEDPDVASIYALALLGTMSRSLIGYSDAHEGHSAALAGSDTQARVAEILERVLRAHPEHPGALHYLLHNQDDPAHAARALPAARTFARLAPESSHARHMPAHIFLQLGLWQDAERSDRSAFSASEAWVARKHLDPAMRNYHALSWRQYELLQLGRYRDARAAIDELAPVVKATGQLGLLSDLASMRARDAIETADWARMASENNFGNANELFAIGISAANTGDRERAERARQGLAERAQDPREGDLRPAIRIMERELSAVVAHAAGRGDEAVRILREAADEEGRLPAPLGLPAPIKPAPELLGEVLLTLGRPGEAIPFFERALARNPNRSRSVLGLARAASAAGDAASARKHYAALLENYRDADADLPLVREARAALDAPTSTSPAAAPAARAGRMTAAVAASIIVVSGALFLLRRRQSAAASKPARPVNRKRRR